MALAAASLLVPAAPGYDPWSWLLWGRELASLELHTAQGPAFKPLPVAITAVLSVTGDAAPSLWLVVARTGAVAAVVLAFAAAAHLAPAPRLVAGTVAAVGVLLTERFVLHAAAGETEPLLVALALGAFLRARAGAHGQALALGIAAALLRTEVWPLLALYGAWGWGALPRLRPALAAAAFLVPVAWFLPEWLSSGELLRSADRARIPNPGAPALAERPALESAARALGLLFVPTALAAAAVRSRAAALPALAGTAWIALVALMAEAGFSGEERYALPGAALVAVTGGVGVARLVSVVSARPAVRWTVAAGLLAVLGGFAGAGAARTAELGSALASSDRLASDLPSAIAAAGGRAVVLRCGRPAVGRLRGPLLAYHLAVPKAVVRADGQPAAVTFRSRRGTGPVTPPADPVARVIAATGRWQVQSRCAPARLNTDRRGGSVGVAVTRSRSHDLDEGLGAASRARRLRRRSLPVEVGVSHRPRQREATTRDPRRE